jgi:hypothetical protein
VMVGRKKKRVSGREDGGMELKGGQTKSER